MRQIFLNKMLHIFTLYWEVSENQLTIFHNTMSSANTALVPKPTQVIRI